MAIELDLANHSHLGPIEIGWWVAGGEWQVAGGSWRLAGGVWRVASRGSRVASRGSRVASRGVAGRESRGGGARGDIDYLLSEWFGGEHQNILTTLEWPLVPHPGIKKVERWSTA